MRDVEQIIHASWLIPIVPADTVLTDHALVIDAGQILAVLPSAAATQAYRAAQEWRLNGQLLMPGLVNAHGHAAMTLLRGLADDHALMEWLQDWIWPAEARWVGEAFVRDGTRLAMAEMLRSGTTCFSDMYFFPDIAAQAVVDAGMRAQIAFPILTHASAWAASADEYLAKGLEVRDRFKANPRLGFAFGPHAPYTNTDATLARVAVLSAELDAPVQIHLHETAGEVAESISRHGLRPLARLDRLGLVSPRLQAVHMTQVAPADIDLLLRERSHVVHCPSSNLKLASGFCPTRTLLAAGVNVCVGTDGAASNNTLDMFAETRLAALLAKGTAADPTALSAHAALRLATLAGAEALGLGERIGSLEPGKDADLIALDLRRLGCQPVYDPYSAVVYAASGTAVTHAWVEGRTLLEAGVLRTVDEGALLDAATAWGSRIMARSPKDALP